MRVAVVFAVLALACGDDDDGAGADATADGTPAIDGWEGFACGDRGWCAPGQACCATDRTALCIESNDTCGGDTWQCDGPEDCITLDKCCDAGFGGQCLSADRDCPGVLLCHEATCE